MLALQLMGRMVIAVSIAGSCVTLTVGLSIAGASQLLAAQLAASQHLAAHLLHPMCACHKRGQHAVGRLLGEKWCVKITVWPGGKGAQQSTSSTAHTFCPFFDLVCVHTLPLTATCRHADLSQPALAGAGESP